jgi:hypothetical protein
MKPSILILQVLLVFSSFSYGQDKSIYKCADSEGIGYRDTPCPTQQEQTLITSARRVNWQSDNAKATQPTDARFAAMPFLATQLFIGMTDTQVLNLPSWGRPAQIIRSKAGHAWREQWIYKDRSTGDERRFLYFENARLVDQEDAPPPPSFQARATVE